MADVDLASENRVLRKQLQALNAQARDNEAVLKRFHERELTLLTAQSLSDLLHNLTDGMRKSFGLRCLSLVLEDPDHEIRHLLAYTGPPDAAFPSVRFTDRLETVCPLYGDLKHPWLGRYLSTEHAQLFSGLEPPESVALLPMISRGRCVGVLNLGSRNGRRFTQRDATDFLFRLGTIGAVCLENATRRECLVISGLTDALTGLYNRRFLERRLKEELARASRDRSRLSCLFLDADYFKRINDAHGHVTGDRVLQEIAKRVRRCLRVSDIAARYGGEEFALILPQICAQQATVLAQRIRTAIANRPVASDEAGQALHITVSIGVSETVPAPHERDFEALGKQLLADADAALYRAKRNGRNRVVQCSAALAGRLTPAKPSPSGAASTNELLC